MIRAVSARCEADKVGGERRSTSIRTTAITIVRGGTVKGWNRERTRTPSPARPSVRARYATAVLLGPMKARFSPTRLLETHETMLSTILRANAKPRLSLFKT